VRTLPAFHILFLIVAFSTFFTKEKQPIPKDWRIIVFILLYIYFFITTTQAYYFNYAWEKFIFNTKVFLPFIFTLILINTREKLYYLIITIGGSIGFLAIKGGIFALLTGFSSRVYGPPGTMFFENNAFAVAVLISIPLLLIWRQQSPNQWIKKGILFSIPIIYACSISSWSRGALLTMVALTFMLIWHSNKKYLALPVALIGLGYAVQHLPEKWISRMHTLETYEEDASAMSRILVWQDGWNHTLEHPFLGAGFEGWRHVSIRDWHSSYVEMFSEHGFIAFGLWLSLLLGTLVSLTQLPKLTMHIESMNWVKNYCFMLRTSLICYMVGALFLGLSNWDLLYHLIFISVLVKKFALEELEEIKLNKTNLKTY